MKRGFLIALVLCVLAPATQAQGTLGTIYFANRLTTVGLDAPAYLTTNPWSGPTRVFPGPAYSAALYLNGEMIPGSLTKFQEPLGQTARAAYIEPINVFVPGTMPGQRNVWVEMRAWLTADGSYENATWRGSSGLLRVDTLGGDIDPSVPNHLPSAFTGFYIMPVPEPSTIALGVFGSALILFFARRRTA
jgi:hypothetical protein